YPEQGGGGRGRGPGAAELGQESGQEHRKGIGDSGHEQHRGEGEPEALAGEGLPIRRGGGRARRARGEAQSSASARFMAFRRFFRASACLRFRLTDGFSEYARFFIALKSPSLSM